MNNVKYSKAYAEVLEIINHFSEEEIMKIPKEKIKFFQDNCDKNYEFKIDVDIPLEEQNISREANAIIVVLYRDYFATEEEKKKIEEVLKKNSDERERQKREKYNPDDIFKNRGNSTSKQVVKEEIKEEEDLGNLPVVKKEDNFFKKFINYVKSLFSKKNIN